MRALSDLRAFLASWCCDLRRQRDFSNLLDAGTATELVTRAESASVAALQSVYTAEQAAAEALRLTRIAQDPASPGGDSITPGEALSISRNLSNAHRAAHRTGQLLA